MMQSCRIRCDSITDLTSVGSVESYTLQSRKALVEGLGSLMQPTSVSSVPMEIPVVKGNFKSLPEEVREFIAENVDLCQPKAIYICDGSEQEAEEITAKMVKRGMLVKVENENYKN